MWSSLAWSSTYCLRVASVTNVVVSVAGPFGEMHARKSRRHARACGVLRSPVSSVTLPMRYSDVRIVDFRPDMVIGIRVVRSTLAVAMSLFQTWILVVRIS